MALQPYINLPPHVRYPANMSLGILVMESPEAIEAAKEAEKKQEGGGEGNGQGGNNGGAQGQGQGEGETPQNIPDIDTMENKMLEKMYQEAGF